MTLNLVIDGLIIALLIAAIGYAVVLSRRLQSLRDSRGELERVVSSLGEAIRQADAGLNEIHHTAESLGRDLDRKIDAARGHNGDLEILLQRAESAADRLESSIGISRQLDQGLSGASVSVPPVREVPARERAPSPQPEPQPKPQSKSRARPAPAKLFVGPAEDENPLAQAAGGSIVKALRGMR